jgi:hypothetical protein
MGRKSKGMASSSARRSASRSGPGNRSEREEPEQQVSLQIKLSYAFAALLVPALCYIGLAATRKGDALPSIGIGLIFLIYAGRAVAQVIRKRSPIRDFEPWRFALFGSVTFSAYAYAFSTTYYALGGGGNGCLAGPASADKLTHLDALYFTITTMTTTGYGDWHPISEACTAAVTIQLVTGFVLFGVVAAVVLSIFSSLLRVVP